MITAEHWCLFCFDSIGPSSAVGHKQNTALNSDLYLPVRKNRPIAINVGQLSIGHLSLRTHRTRTEVTTSSRMSTRNGYSFACRDMVVSALHTGTPLIFDTSCTPSLTADLATPGVLLRAGVGLHPGRSARIRPRHPLGGIPSPRQHDLLSLHCSVFTA